MNVKTLKKILLCCSCILTVLSISPVTALEDSTFTDLLSSNANVNNLINLAYNHSSFKSKDYVVYQSNQYSYYIVWGNIIYTNGILYSDDIEFINYSRVGSVGSYQYDYVYGTDNDFKLSIDHIVTSNISDVGMVSNVFKQYQYNDYFIKLLIFAISILFSVMLLLFRR